MAEVEDSAAAAVAVVAGQHIHSDAQRGVLLSLSLSFHFLSSYTRTLWLLLLSTGCFLLFNQQQQQLPVARVPFLSHNCPLVLQHFFPTANSYRQVMMAKTWQSGSFDDGTDNFPIQLVKNYQFQFFFVFLHQLKRNTLQVAWTAQVRFNQLVNLSSSLLWEIDNTC